MNKRGKKTIADDDLPAIVRANGTRFWYKDGKLHRDNDLPAIVWANGKQEWGKEGKRHRDNDLPVVVYSDVQYNDVDWKNEGF